MENKALSILMIAGSIFLMTTLTGCFGSDKDVQTVKPQLSIPAEMLQCEDSIPRPTGDIIMESQVSRYINSLEFTNKDCKIRLKEIELIVKCFNDEKCNVDSLAEYMGVVRQQNKR